MNIPVDNMELGSITTVTLQQGNKFSSFCNCGVEDKMNTMSLKKPKTSKKYEQYYKEAYAMEFQCITKSKKGATFAFCTICQCELSVSWW